MSSEKERSVTERNKERGPFINGFIALLPSRSFGNSKTKTGHHQAPRFGLVLGSALGLLPSIALSSAQAGSNCSRLNWILVRNRNSLLDNFYIAAGEARSAGVVSKRSRSLLMDIRVAHLIFSWNLLT